jgi:cyanophycinase-like exopeptidase
MPQPSRAKGCRFGAPAAGLLLAWLLPFAAAPCFSKIHLLQMPGRSTTTSTGPGYVAYSLAAAKPTPPRAPVFGLAMLGGGGDVDQAARFLCDHSGGGEIVVLRATEDDSYNTYFHGICPENSVITLVISSAQGADAPFVAQHLRSAHAIFISGGDQSNYVKFWTGAATQREINLAIERGVPLGGISAGLAVQGQFAFSALLDTVTSEEALANPFNPKVTLDRNFLSIPPLAGIITDSHFSARQRMGRTIAFLSRIVHDGWASTGHAIGIDEATAVLVDGQNRATAVGKGAAWFIELDHQPELCAMGRPLTVRNVKVYELPAAPRSKFDLTRWTGAGGRAFTLNVVNGVLDARPKP